MRHLSNSRVTNDEGWTFGSDRTELRALVDHWAGAFDWRRQEEDMNRFAHYRADVRGFDIHFIHERGVGYRPLPIILTHGYPDSFLRFAKIIPMLTRPEEHGGDWGSTVTEQLARSHARSVVGVHLTDVPFWHLFQTPTDLSRDEQRYIDTTSKWQQTDGAYALIQGTRPYSLARALDDSPVGLASWMVDKFHAWSDCGGNVERRFTKDELLTNVT